jgi:phage terminase large subunit-like protein
LDAAAWADCCRSDFELDAIAGLPAYVGVDLSSRLDLTAAVAVVPLPDGRFLFLPQFWLPGVGIDKRSVHEMDYRDAARQGHVELVPGETIDYAEVEGWIAGLEDACGVRPEQIGFDPWRAKELAARLEDRGFDCVQVKQGWQLSEPCLRFESLIATREAVHLGNSVLSWCIGNVERRTDQNGKMRPVKPTGPRRIDGVVAAVEGLYLAMFAEPDGFLFG